MSLQVLLSRNKDLALLAPQSGDIFPRLRNKELAPLAQLSRINDSIEPMMLNSINNEYTGTSTREL